MTGDQLPRASTWRKSSRSIGPETNCVELYHVGLPITRVAVRDSKNPRGSALALTHGAWHHLRATLDGTRVT